MMTTCLETFATLRIFSKSIDPEAIEQALGIEATACRPLNPLSRYRTERENHFWAWSTQGSIESLDGLEHIRALLSLLQDKQQPLEQLRQAGCEIDVCCYRVSSGQGGPTLDVPALAELARLGLEIWWDIYFGKEDDYARDGNASEMSVAESAGSAQGDG
jgi:hypothetical protein